tara:strand:+ start:83 stop:310 length:228 start_codon:yes stop_codon:yes gene_type:complete
VKEDSVSMEKCTGPVVVHGKRVRNVERIKKCRTDIAAVVEDENQKEKQKRDAARRKPKEEGVEDVVNLNKYFKAI